MSRIALVFTLAAAFQADEDKIGKLKPPQVLGKAQAAWLKKKGCHFKEDAVSTLLARDGGGEATANFEGKLQKDFAAFTGAADAYARGKDKLIKARDGSYVEPRKADAALNRTGSILRNPWLTVNELARFAAPAAFAGEEKVGEADCTIVETAADEKSVQEQIKEVTGDLKSLEQYFIRDMSAVADRKKSSSLYKAWISKTDLLVAKVEWTLTIVMNKNAIPFDKDQVPDQIAIKYTMHFTKYDTELELDIPAPVKRYFKLP
jgi:hypothetical protein